MKEKFERNYTYKWLKRVAKRNASLEAMNETLWNELRAGMWEPPQAMTQFFVVPLAGRRWLWLILAEPKPNGIQFKCIKALS